MTAGERLAQLAGHGGTASALLAAIGAGATAGAMLVAYSGLPTGTAAAHLMTDVVAESAGGGGWYGRFAKPATPKEIRRPVEDDEAFLLSVLL